MDDHDLVDRINRLAEEEHRLERAEGADGLTAPHQERRRGIEVPLDQCWDLLRQRRARRDAGLDPDEVAVRPPGVVEGYQQ